jgi:hypothetical protein
VLGETQIANPLAEFSERRVRDRARRHGPMLPMVHMAVYRPRSTDETPLVLGQSPAGRHEDARGSPDGEFLMGVVVFRLHQDGEL